MKTHGSPDASPYMHKPTHAIPYRKTTPYRSPYRQRTHQKPEVNTASKASIVFFSVMLAISIVLWSVGASLSIRDLAISGKVLFGLGLGSLVITSTITGFSKVFLNQKPSSFYIF